MEPGQRFFNPTRGWIPANDVARHLQQFVDLTYSGSLADYQIWVGTDSPGVNGDPVALVTAIVIRKIGNGGIFFLAATPKAVYPSTRDRLRAELGQTMRWLDWVSGQIEARRLRISIQVHIDIGRQGDSRDMIQSLVAHAQTAGFPTYIKPYAPAASRVAHRFAGLRP